MRSMTMTNSVDLHPATSQDALDETTTVLRIEHTVLDFDAWMRAFDADPLGRAASGVVRHRVMRDANDPSYMMIDLEFTTADDAAAMLVSLRELWGRVTGTLITDPKGRIVEIVERTTY